MTVTIPLGFVQRFLVDAIFVVALAGLAVEFAQDGLGLDDPYDLVDLFSLSYERNIPTWLSSGLHGTAAILLAVIARGKQEMGAPYIRHWWALSVIFAYISIDEFVLLHEEMNSWFDLPGVLYFGWVIPASVLVSIFVLSYGGFLGHLSALARYRFVRAGAVFVMGAMGIELVLGYWTDLYGSSNLGKAIIDWFEETMEMVGMALFISALVAELAGESGVVRFVEKGVPVATAVTWQSTTAAEPTTRYGSASHLDPLAEVESSAEIESSQRDAAISYPSDDMPKA